MLQAPGALSDDPELPWVLKGDTGVTEGLEGEKRIPGYGVWCLRAAFRQHWGPMGAEGGDTRGTG